MSSLKPKKKKTNNRNDSDDDNDNNTGIPSYAKSAYIVAIRIRHYRFPSDYTGAALCATEHEEDGSGEARKKVKLKNTAD